MLAYPSFFILLLLLDQMVHIDIVDSYSFVPRRKYGFFLLFVFIPLCVRIAPAEHITNELSRQKA